MSTLKVAILWHFHQPSYWDPQAEHYRYPWVFLHAARHYHAMAIIARDHPGVRMAFNFTPVLVEQMDHYTSGVPLRDRILGAVLKPAESLSEEELELVLDHVFKLNLRTMVFPFPRYRELHAILGANNSSTRRPRITPPDIRDLQVLYLLTWCGVGLRRNDLVSALIEKGSGYTEEEKEGLFSTMRAAVGETLGIYRELQDAGQVEVTTTPYYHPILPLVIDSASARESRHDVDLEEIDFRHPADAEWHVRAARSSYHERFARDPVGMWPSEGSVSDAALRIMAREGFRWAGTDEGILARSLGSLSLPPRQKYRPYRFADTDLWVYFRDRELSDRIGFTYSGWRPEEAVDDIVGRLLQIRDSLHGATDGSCATIILDGENPWEYYPDSGLGFLEGLYTRLSTMGELEPVRFCDHRETAAGITSLGHIVPGSWIDSNFDTWIGGPEKNHAWKLLAASRRKLQLEAPDVQPPVEVYRAEGSDWFWWLGPGHDTPYESSYENIFRLNLRNGLEKVGVRPPDALEESVAPPPTPLFQPPIHLTTPQVNGRPGNYYDWIAAGYFEASEGSFHRIHRHLERIRFGFDEQNLYVRVEGAVVAELGEGEKIEVRIAFDRPRDLTIIYAGDGLRRVDAEGNQHEFRGRVAREIFLEMALPFEELGAQVGDPVEFAVVVVAEGKDIDRIPQSGCVITSRPGTDFGLENWSV